MNVSQMESYSLYSALLLTRAAYGAVWDAAPCSTVTVLIALSVAARLSSAVGNSFKVQLKWPGNI